MDNRSKILIVGHDDIVERALSDFLVRQGCRNVFSSSRLGIDTTIQSAVYQFFSDERPEYVFLGSVKSGGIEANQKYPAEFFYANSESQNNVVYAAHKFGVKKLMYLASSCVYPRQAPQPMKPESLMTGALEPTSEAYAMAKLAGIKLCQAYRKQYGLPAVIAVLPTVYGPESDVDLETAHVLGALIHKFYEAKKSSARHVVIWGTGSPQRDFLYRDDFASAALFLMEHYRDPAVINVATTGSDVTIKSLAEKIKTVSGFSGEIAFDRTKPDGAMVKLLDHEPMMRLGWRSKVSIDEGIEYTYAWYVKKRESMR